MAQKELIIECDGVEFNFSTFLSKVLSSSKDRPVILTDIEKQFVENCKRLSQL